MSTIEDFENALVGATATNSDGGRAMKMDYVGRRWMHPNGFCVDDEEMKQRGYTLDTLEPVPASVREALDLAWALAHEVKEGQVIPEGTRYLEVTRSGLRERTAVIDHTIKPRLAQVFRTLEPLPEPEPDWLDAPAVLARLDVWERDEREVFSPVHEGEGHWVAMFSTLTYHWSNLRDVTPLYPKGPDA